MNTLSPHTLRINITGSKTKVLNTFLRIFLANERLTDRQLDVVTALASFYSEYAANGVKEPYASTLLFSTEVRKQITTALKISSAHLNNTFNSLAKKGILAKEDKKYLMNPNIIPTSKLLFTFVINE